MSIESMDSAAGPLGAVTDPPLPDPPPTELTIAELTISEVAQDAGVAVSAVRFYERQGLVASVRTPGNQRRFTTGAGCRIRVARVAQRVGLTVREIAEILDGLPAQPQPGDWEQVARTLVAEARARVRALESALDDLGSGARLCELDPVGDAPVSGRG